MSYADLQKGRISITSHAYHLTMVTQNREPIFTNNAIAGIAMSQLRHSAETSEVKSLAWVVMPDHIHWLVQLRNMPLSAVARKFKGRTARAINQHKGATGTRGSITGRGVAKFRSHAGHGNSGAGVAEETARGIHVENI